MKKYFRNSMIAMFSIVAISAISLYSCSKDNDPAGDDPETPAPVAASQTDSKYFAEGFVTPQTPPKSFAEGFVTPQTPSKSFAEGFVTPQTPSKSFAEGFVTPQTPSKSFAEGFVTPQTPSKSFAEGFVTPQTPSKSFAEGFVTPQTSPKSFAEGFVTPQTPSQRVYDKNPSIALHKQNRKRSLERGYRRWDFCRTPINHRHDMNMKRICLNNIRENEKWMRPFGTGYFSNMKSAKNFHRVHKGVGIGYVFPVYSLCSYKLQKIFTRIIHMNRFVIFNSQFAIIS